MRNAFISPFCLHWIPIKIPKTKNKIILIIIDIIFKLSLFNEIFP